MSDELISALDTQEKLRMSVVDRDFIISPVVLSSQEVRYYDGPIVYEEFVPTEGFILDSAIYGILDTSELDATGETYAITTITNPNDVFNFFGSTEEASILVHSATATLSSSGRTITFSGAQNIVLRAYIDQYTITSATPVIEATSFDDSENYVLAVSADAGTTWTNVGNGETYTFASTEQGEDLRFRITSLASGVIRLKDSYGALLPFRLRYTKI